MPVNTRLKPSSSELGLGLLNSDELGRDFPALRLLVLFGSRARGQSVAGSDWDFGYLAEPGLDVDSLCAFLSKVVHADDIDVVDLRRSSGVLRHQVAEQGVAVFEREPEAFTNYIIEVLRFWLDAEPVIRKSQQEQLRALG